MCSTASAQADEIDATAADIRKSFGIDVAYSAADMSDPTSIKEMIATALASWKRIDILVNNAGIQHVAPLESFPTDKWDKVIAIDLSSAFHTTRLVLSAMRRREMGPHHQHLVGARADRLAVQGGLRRREAWHDRPHQGDCAGDRRGRHHLQRNLPGLRLDALVEAQIADQAKAHDIDREAVIRDVLLKKQPNKRFATIEEIGATGRLPRQRGRGLDHRARR